MQCVNVDNRLCVTNAQKRHHQDLGVSNNTAAPLKNSEQMAVPFHAAFPFSITPEQVCPFVRHEATVICYATVASSIRVLKTLYFAH